MKTIARLMLVYFTGTPLARALTAFGLAAVITSGGVFAIFPPFLERLGPRFAAISPSGALLLLLLAAGGTALLFGGSLMPVVVARLASSHYAYVLPHGRGKLLGSALMLVVALALAAALGSLASFDEVAMGLPPRTVFARSLAGALMTYSLLYVVLWLVGRARSPLAIIGGSLLVIATLVLPLRIVMNPQLSLFWTIVPTVALWTAVGSGLLFAARIRRAAVSLRARLQRRARDPFASAYDGGDEVELMIGTARPWLLALGQAVPIVLAAYWLGWLYGDVAVDRKVQVWLCYLTMLTMLSAGTATFTPARSRALWLRAHWTRAELFARVEAAHWKRNSYALGVLLVTMTAVGIYFGLPTRPLAFGLALLVLAATVSMYLGLTITRSLGWGITAIALGSILLLLATSLYATRPAATTATIVVLEALLAALAVALRSFAKRRWLGLDWMLSRPETVTRAAA